MVKFKESRLKCEKKKTAKTQEMVTMPLLWHKSDLCQIAIDDPL